MDSSAFASCPNAGDEQVWDGKDILKTPLKFRCPGTSASKDARAVAKRYEDSIKKVIVEVPSKDGSGKTEKVEFYEPPPRRR